MDTTQRYTIEEIVDIISQLPVWDQKEIIRRLDRGGSNTIYGRYRFGYNTY